MRWTPDSTADIIPITFDETVVMTKLTALKTDKAPGPDGIHPLF